MVLLILSFLYFLSAHHFCLTEITNSSDVTGFLIKYGYLSEDNVLRTDKEYRNAIIEYQKFTNISVTGELNEKTLKFMNKPRCGLPDMFTVNGIARKRRYATDGFRWPSTVLTYKLGSTTSDLDKNKILTEIERAFKLWSAETTLSLTHITNEKDTPRILIEFKPKEEFSDASSPANDDNHGDIYFNDEKTWTLTPDEGGTNLFQVAAHMFGHSLGLDHSDVPDALMFPNYLEKYNQDVKLHTDDIEGIKYIYGGKNSDCISLGGKCQDKTDNEVTCEGNDYESGHCSGNWKIQCCLPTGCKREAYYEKTCAYYNNKCLSEYLDPKSDLEAFEYAKELCSVLLKYTDKFDEQGQEWNFGVRKCVMKNLYKYFESVRPPKAASFDKLLLKYISNCNLRDSIPNLCQLIEDEDELSIFADIMVKDADWSKSDFWYTATFQTINMLIDCETRIPFYQSQEKFKCGNNNLNITSVSEDMLNSRRDKIEETIQVILNEIEARKTETHNLIVPKSGITPNCIFLAEDGNCEFFSTCLEQRFSCNKGGFALEGPKLCNKLDNSLGLFNNDGRIWALSMKKCLTTKLLPIYYSQDALSCQHIRAAGDTALINCFPANMVCSVIYDDRNAFAVSKVFQDKNDFIKNYGINFKHLMTNSMRLCYEFNLLPFCLKPNNYDGLQMRVRTENVKLEDELANGWVADKECLCRKGTCKKIEDKCPDGFICENYCTGKGRWCYISSDVENEIEDSCVDRTFLCSLEAFVPIGYVPKNSDKKPNPYSGVTIGSGVDLYYGRTSEGTLDEKFSRVPAQIIEKLEPYFNKRGHEAQFLLDQQAAMGNRLKLTFSEARQLTTAVEDYFINEMKKRYEELIKKYANLISGKEAKEFTQLTRAQRTILLQFYYNHGFSNKLENYAVFERAVGEQKWEDVIEVLKFFYKKTTDNYTKTDCKNKQFSRQCRSATHLEEDDLHTGINTKKCPI